MITCQHCGTKNKENATLCQQCGRPLAMAKPKTVAEQIPNWLKLLLTKYGEQPGPIIGLEMDPLPGIDDVEPVDPGMLSNLLEQMAEDGPPPAPSSGFGSS